MSKIQAFVERGPEAQRDVLPPPADRARLRKAHGAGQKAVADLLGVTVSAVSAWETGRNEPSGTIRAEYAELLRLIAERYDIPFDSSEETPE